MITKQEFKERNELLIADLRNPENKQTRTRLRIEDCYCCLGRACEVFRQKTGQGEWVQLIAEPNPRERWRFNVNFLSKAAMPPNETAEWYGWFDANPDLEEDRSMIDLNDGDYLAFSEIANMLESWMNHQLATRQWSEENA